MKAITIFENDDGTVTVIASGNPTYIGGIELLHKAMLELLKVSKGDS